MNKGRNDSPFILRAAHGSVFKNRKVHQHESGNIMNHALGHMTPNLPGGEVLIHD